MVLLEPKGSCSKHHHIQRRKKRWPSIYRLKKIVAIVTLKGLTSLKKKGGAKLLCPNNTSWTHLKFNSSTLKKGWLEDDSASYWGSVVFSGAFAVKLQGGNKKACKHIVNTKQPIVASKLAGPHHLPHQIVKVLYFKIITHQTSKLPPTSDSQIPFFKIPSGKLT